MDSENASSAAFVPHDERDQKQGSCQTHTAQIAQEVCVKAAVGLWQAEGEDQKEKSICINEDAKSLIFIDKADAETKEYHFTFDGVFNFSKDQDKALSDLIQSMLNSVLSGYNVSILLCGIDNPGMDSILGGKGNQLGLIFQIIELAFQGVHPTDQEDSLVTVAFMQVSSDGLVSYLL
ncbi:kinesin klp-20 isoform X1 [Pelobates cultripes]|uniref:Kinesin klp-20 isoform X1 n=1 Tax=Pelobates cultripes TaxID=61616 RepID=A0AAD1RP79_PELCU|nr:kinesin klp-20 isoform X1 [Pelobates cultripes]